MRLSTRAPLGAFEPPPQNTDPDTLNTIIEDAAHYPGGHAERLAIPRTEGQIAWVLAHHSRVLPIGAQSSLTGGATPTGDVVLSTSGLNAILDIEKHTVKAQAGVSLAALQDALDLHNLWYPPVPTYTGAFVGGCVATNAAGAATFKYGTTRDWVVAMTIVLANGEVLELHRGEMRASDEGQFEIATADGQIAVPLPRYRVPQVPKCSAGYFAAPGMDLIDLFIGSEGTLGIITDVTLRVVARPRRRHLAVIAVPDERQALTIAADLRALSLRDRADQDPNGLDVVGIESIDRRSLDLARQDVGLDRYNLELPGDTTP